MQVVLKDGFSLDIDDKKLDDYELMEALTDIDKGKAARITDAVDILLGEEKSRLFEHIREEKGYVSMEVVKNALLEVITGLKNGKNS